MRHSSSITLDIQIIAIIVLLAYAANRPSPVSPNQNEWEACDKPLGAWNAIWVPRLVLDAALATYRWRKQREKRISTTRYVPFLSKYVLARDTKPMNILLQPAFRLRAIRESSDLERARDRASGAANPNTLPPLLESPRSSRGVSDRADRTEPSYNYSRTYSRRVHFHDIAHLRVFSHFFYFTSNATSSILCADYPRWVRCSL